MKNLGHHHRMRNITLHVALASMLWGPVAPAMAEPAQNPLLNRPVLAVTPNVFFTFDDSGSMAFSFLPDEMGDPIYDNDGRYPIANPADPINPPNGACVVPTSGTNGTTNIESAGSSFQAAVDFRNPAKNKLYYNPATRYRPWMKSDGTDFPSITDASRAPLDPSALRTYSTFDSIPSSVTRVNLRDVVNVNSGSRRWCLPTTTSNATNTRRYSPAIYFNGNTRVDISAAASTATYAKGTDRTDCAGATCSREEELRNFANWFTYYRTRNYLAIAASTRAFGKQTQALRVGYGRINNLNSVEGAPGAVVRGVRDFTSGSTTRNEFFNWLYTVPASGGTPLRRAMDNVGQYFTQKGDHGPWGNTPGGTVTQTATKQAACRKSYHILMTDGYWNGDDAPTSGARLDVDSTKAATITGPDNKTYTYDPATQTKFKDNYGNTLADIAMYYWVNDLRPGSDGLENIVPRGRNVADADYAFWQNLTTYTVGLGVSGSVSTGTAPPAGGWPRPDNRSGATAARDTVPGTQGDKYMVDDLWHAAVNGHGQYVSAQSAAEFETALNGFLQEVARGQQSDSGVSVSSVALASDTKVYIPSYDPGTWTGNIEAFRIGTTGSPLTPAWNVNDKLPATRNIVVWDNATGKAVDFGPSMASNLRDKTLWNLAAAPTTDLINFIKGDKTNEGKTFRCRGTLDKDGKCVGGDIGDIVNSTPVQVQKSLDMSYQFLPKTFTGYDTYRTYVDKKKSRSKGVLFAGANDGMLHAFDDSTGTEIMGFIPYAVIGNLSRLADPNYGTETTPALAHRFYVDGPLAEADAVLDSAWSNVVTGSTGAGGRSVFALKVDTQGPTSMGTSNVLWELNSSTPGFTEANELGYVLQPIAVGPAMNKRWVAIFGNGVDSPNGNASLFVVDLATGKPIKVITTNVGAGNGLGGVTLIRNSERVIVGAYAGDLKGNLWRFDLEGADSGSWKVGHGGVPLFSTNTTPVKPITAPPSYLFHPKGGLMVIFGTGKLYRDDDTSTPSVNESDLVNTDRQTVYGIWDKTIPGNPSNAGTAISGTNSLVEQTFSLITTNYWSLSKNPVDWATKRGWFIDLTLAPANGPSQRSLFAPQIFSDLVLMTTVAPIATGDICAGSAATAYDLLFNPFTGGRTTISAVSSGVANTVVGAYQRAYTGSSRITYAPGTRKGVIIRGRGETTQADTPKAFVQRNWSQIYNHP